MAEREWKPGDVALLRHNDGSVRRSMLSDDAHWHCFDMPSFGHTPEESELRRLVVIDPEDQEVVTQLADALVAAHEASGNPNTKGYGVCSDWLSVQAALRQFANPTPPKPDEPTGLGAVVEDAEGDKWVRLAPRIADFDWFNVADPNRTRAYRNIAAVKVHSEGVQQ